MYISLGEVSLCDFFTMRVLFKKGHEVQICHCALFLNPAESPAYLDPCWRRGD